MALTLKRSSVAIQVADALRSEILRGAWREWIPTERELSHTLHVSRSTCRAGLKILYKEGLLIAEKGRGIRVNQRFLRKPRAIARYSRSVGIIIPDIVNLRPFILLIIDELRRELFDLGVRLDLHHNPAFYKPKPDVALEKLVKQTSHNCWILMMSPHSLQQWFEKRDLPCLTLGSTFPDITLPAVGYDYRAICRHAVGKFVGLGHRRIVFLNRRQRAAGDLQGETGFFEGVRGSSQRQVNARVVYHDDTQESVNNLVRKMFAESLPPTALLVANPYCYLSIMSSLADCGFRIPEDVSLISRDDDPSLAYVYPEPARYLYNGRGHARKAMLFIRRSIEGDSTKFESIALMAKFTAGKSLRQK